MRAAHSTANRCEIISSDTAASTGPECGPRREADLAPHLPGDGAHSLANIEMGARGRLRFEYGLPYLADHLVDGLHGSADPLANGPAGQAVRALQTHSEPEQPLDDRVVQVTGNPLMLRYQMHRLQDVSGAAKGDARRGRRCEHLSSRALDTVERLGVGVTDHNQGAIGPSWLIMGK